MQSMERILPREHWLPLGFLVLLSYVTFVHGFWNPPALYWDENYHIASAQKYMNGIFFMEPHPPLGKLLIAAGEVITNFNVENNQFIDTDYATTPPPGFIFTGYRVFPVLLAWLIAPLLYGIFFLLTKKPLWSLLLSFLYIFDTALIVHSRAAMLDSTMLFFSCVTILGFLVTLRATNDRWILIGSLLYGIGFACALATKAFALLFIMMLPILLWKHHANLSRLWKIVAAAGAAFVVLTVGIWYTHFFLAHTVNPKLPDAGYYQSSDRAIEILDAGASRSPLAFPTLLKDAFDFVPHYEAGVPELDLAKSDENGSPWFLWPVGARTISYRWATDDSYSYRYLYLVANPVVWGIALLGLFLAAILFIAPYLAQEIPKSPLHWELGTFLLLYACFMAAVSRIDRVMYLYHYFLPLIFTFILVGIVVVSLRHIGKITLTAEMKTLSLLVMGVLIFVGFQIYRPFAYYEPLTDDQVTRRAIFKIWDMRCTECEAPHVLAKPVTQ